MNIWNSCEGSDVLYILKTKETDEDVLAFIENIAHLQKRQDAYQLLDIFTETTGKKAKMWGPSIIGFGKYQYKYKSGHQGEAPLVGFSPRKAKHSLYIASGDWRAVLLEQFGKFKAGKSCIYINKLADIDLAILKQLITESVKQLQTAEENTFLS